MLELDELKQCFLATCTNYPLLKNMVQKTLPRGFLAELVMNTYQNQQLCNDVCGQKFSSSYLSYCV